MGSSSYDEKATGALPPPDKAWQIGKTAASIAFVNEAEAYLAEHEGETGLEALKDAVEDVKSGDWSLDEYQTVAQFLSQQS